MFLYASWERGSQPGEGRGVTASYSGHFTNFWHLQKLSLVIYASSLGSCL